MYISDDGVNLIIKWEGLSNTAYKDIVGIPTIGVGFTYYLQGYQIIRGGTTILTSENDKVRMGDYMHTPEIMAMFRVLVHEIYGLPVHKLIKVPISQYQYDVLVSLAYNIGVKAFSKSTLLGLLNQGNYDAAREQLLRWDRAGGAVSKGLTNRRKDEYAYWARPHRLV